MEQKTLDMFVSTCTYLNYLADNIMTSNTEIPPEALVIVNSLMSKLFGFMNHMYSTESKSRITSAVLNSSNIDHNNVLPNYGPPAFNSFPHEAQFSSTIPVYQGNLTPLPGVPISHYGNPSTGQMCFNQQLLLTGPPLRQSPTGFSTEPPENLPVSHDKLSSSMILPCKPSASNINDFNLQSSTIEKGCTNQPSVFVNASNTKLPPFNKTSDPCPTLPKNERNQAQNLPGSNQSPRSASAQSKKSFSTRPKPATPVQQYSEGVEITDSTDSGQIETNIKKSGPSDIYVTKLFNCYIDGVLDGSLNVSNMGVYCRPCDVMVMKPWTTHQNKRHSDGCKKSKRPIMYSCSICGISLFGPKYIMLKYFEYHYNKVHAGKTKQSWQEVLVDVASDYPLLKNSNSSSVSSLNKFESNTPDAKKQIHSNKQNNHKERKEKQTHNDKHNNDKLVKEKQIFSVKTTNTVDTNPKQNSAPAAEPETIIYSNTNKKASAAAPASSLDLLGSSPYPLFDNVLYKIIEEWNKSSILIEVGFCDVCQSGIFSAFEWFSHVEEHLGNSVEGREKICSLCHVKVFGLDHDKYFNLPAHSKLDKIVNS